MKRWIVLWLGCGLVCVLGGAAWSESPADVTPPHLVALDFSPRRISAANLHEPLKITARVQDDISGVTDGIINGKRCGLPQVQFCSPSGHQIIVLLSAPQNLVAGNPRDGIFEATIRIARNMEPGAWRISSLYLLDDAGNARWIDQAQLQERGFPTEFRIHTALFLSAANVPWRQWYGLGWGLEAPAPMLQ